MKKLICRVVRDSNSWTYLVSDRLNKINEGDYIIDETNTIYMLYAGHFISVNGIGQCPTGKYHKVEASDNPEINVKRITRNFVRFVSYNYPHINGVIIDVNEHNGYFRTDRKGNVMVTTKGL